MLLVLVGHFLQTPAKVFIWHGRSITTELDGQVLLGRTGLLQPRHQCGPLVVSCAWNVCPQGTQGILDPMPQAHAIASFL